MNYIGNTVSTKEELPKDLLQSLRTLIDESTWPSVLIEIKELTKKFPNSATLKNIEGDAYFHLHEFNNAIDSYKQVLRLDPHRAEIYFNLGVLAELKRNLDLAIQYFQQGINLKDNFSICHYKLGNSFYFKGNQKAAIENYNEAIRINPGYAEAYAGKGAIYKEKGQILEAIASYRAAVSIKPEWTEVKNNLGLALLENEDLNEAIRHFRECIDSRPDYIQGYNNLGLALKQKGYSHEALKIYRKALEIQPDFPEVNNNIGNILQEKGEIDTAVYFYKRAIEVNPDHAEAYNNLGTAFDELRNYDAAAEYFQQAVKICPDSSGAWSNLGIVLNRKKQYEEAISAFQKAVKLNPHDSKSMLPLAKILFQLGRYDVALSNLEKVLIEDPSCNEAIYYIALIKLEIGQNKIAFEYIEKGLSNKPNDGMLAHVYAAALACVGEIRSSIDVLKQILKLNSISPKIVADLIQFSSYDPKLDSKILFKEFCNSINEKQRLSDQNYKEPRQEIIGLVGFGRSGSLFLHSLIDGHPNVFTLPGYYFKGWFGEHSWELISAKKNTRNWREELAESVCDHFEPQFNAYSKKNVPGKPNGYTDWLAREMGFTKMGPNHSEVLELKQSEFKEHFIDLLKPCESIDQRRCFEMIHKAFDLAYRGNQKVGSLESKTIFYHIHNPDNFEHANFINHYPKAKILYIVRHPIQMLESWLRSYHNELIRSSTVFQKKIWYNKIVNRISFSFRPFYNPLNSLTETKGVKLEDIKRAPKDTLGSIANWIGIEEHHSLYKSEFLDREYSTPSANFNGISGFDNRSIDVGLGRFFGERDIQILETLFWPILASYQYTDLTKKEFIKKLKDIRPWLDEPFQFEKEIHAKISKEKLLLEKSESSQAFHRNLINVWNTLNDSKSYPHLFEPLSINRKYNE